MWQLGTIDKQTLPTFFRVPRDTVYTCCELVKFFDLQQNIVSYETETGSYETETIPASGFMKLKLTPVSVS